ncbi:unnamed protein product, partial [Prorocentrum cordatum]
MEGPAGAAGARAERGRSRSRTPPRHSAEDGSAAGGLAALAPAGPEEERQGQGQQSAGWAARMRRAMCRAKGWLAGEVAREGDVALAADEPPPQQPAAPAAERGPAEAAPPL